MSQRGYKAVRGDLTTQVVRSAGPKDQEVTTTEHNTVGIDGLNLVKVGKAVSQVEIGARTKVSESVRYGSGNWDKVPFSIEVSASVRLDCDQDISSIEDAKVIAKNMAIEAVSDTMTQALASHIHDIRESLFPGLFSGD